MDERDGPRGWMVGEVVLLDAARGSDPEITDDARGGWMYDDGLDWVFHERVGEALYALRGRKEDRVVDEREEP
ncbi:hypothetical protein NUW54_g14778 [Trametes sanguinea]|uniref:Uncharacterized protein n=1 Tax=Trametes sanguinea TaxID=158606 RepID=A0ACC1MBB0_9APHY|nr:hypothetical protein NUW54_g14778 [Trametes sanguinea]